MSLMAVTHVICKVFEGFVMKIAVTSQNFRTVTPHAGKARRFLLYELNPDGEVAEAGRLDLDRVMTIQESGDAEHPLDSVEILITGSAGAGFVQRFNLRGIRVVLTGERDPIQAINDLLNNRIKPPNPHACNQPSHQQHRECGCSGRG
jgi:predicted Fe-Mo cluster-binding NifX family protein